MRKLLPVVSAFGLMAMACPTALPSPDEPVEVAANLPAAKAEEAVEELGLTVTASLPDGGTAALTFDSAGPRPSVEPTQTLEVLARPALQNFRLRVFDEGERAVVSDDEVEEGPEGLRYRIRFPEPLKSGFRYTLVLDAQAGPTALDAHGRPAPDQRLEFSIAGERAKPPPPTVNAKKRGKRRGR